MHMGRFPVLFHGTGIFDVLQNQERQLRDEAGRLDAASVNSAPVEDLVHELAAKYKLDIPVLDEEKVSREAREVQVDVSADPMRRMIYGDGGPFHVPGVEITISVPFRGDPGLFAVQPSTHNLNPPRGEVHGNELRFTYTRTDNDGNAVRAEFDRTIAGVKQHLQWLSESVREFNANLGTRAQEAIAQRKQQVGGMANMIAAIGIPERQEAQPAAPKRPLSTEAVQRSTASPKKWDVFISHATEDKDAVARPLATALRDAGLAVWYDEFSLKMGNSLRGSIDYGLANSRYGVVILSPNFFAKQWPVKELNGLTALEAGGKNLIRPIWHNVSAEQVLEFSPTLADRVALKSKDGIAKIVAAIVASMNEG